MTQASDQFEQRVGSIHRLLESTGSVIIWNDRIHDPDNPSQTRQIDVTIRRDGTLTIVECRLHREPQDVKWVEELMGRRTSLRADTAIAVSASGFTAGAKAKAKAFGVILRDFRTVSDQEVLEWGRRRRVGFIYFEFKDVRLTAVLSTPPPYSRTLTSMDGHPIHWRALFDDLIRKSGDRVTDSLTYFDAPLDPPILVGGLRPRRLHLSGQIRRVINQISLSSVTVYRDPGGGSDLVNIGTYKKNIELMEKEDSVTLILDCAEVQIDDNRLFSGIEVDFGGAVTLEGFTAVGRPELTQFRVPIFIEIRYAGST